MCVTVSVAMLRGVAVLVVVVVELLAFGPSELRPMFHSPRRPDSAVARLRLVAVSERNTFVRNILREGLVDGTSPQWQMRFRAVRHYRSVTALVRAEYANCRDAPLHPRRLPGRAP